MIDTGVTTAEPPSSTFDHLPPRGRNPDPDDLDRLAASLDDLLVCCCKPGADEAGGQVAIEPMNDHKQFLSGAVRAAGEQF